MYVRFNLLPMNEQLSELFKRYFDGVVTEAERQALMEQVMASGNEHLESVMREHWETLQEADADVPESSHILAAVLGKPVLLRPVWKRWRWVAAAAVLIIIIATAGYFQLQPLQKVPVAEAIKNISPGYEQATLTLDDGSVQQLDNSGKRVLQQGGTVIRQQGGQLIYTGPADNDVVRYNTLRTPRGGLFRIILPDGTKVWLNAESSLKYPTTFSALERRVELTGEGFFEVAHDEQKPFYVLAGGNVYIKVLGTQFNVNAYHDESSIKTTLLQGVVAVSTGYGEDKAKRVILKPRQQARCKDPLSGITVENNVDVSGIIAWKNGAFNLEGASLQEVMRQLERWYDIKVVYEGNVPDTYFTGKISRQVKLPSVLKALEEWGVNFRMEAGNRLVVSP